MASSYWIRFVCLQKLDVERKLCVEWAALLLTNRKSPTKGFLHGRFIFISPSSPVRLLIAFSCSSCLCRPAFFLLVHGGVDLNAGYPSIPYAPFKLLRYRIPFNMRTILANQCCCIIDYRISRSNFSKI